MIVICEPHCKKFSHEKVNSGFIYGLRLAYPDEKIRLYAEPSHIDALKSIITHDGLQIPNLECCPIDFEDTSSFRGIKIYHELLKRIFSESERLGVDRLFFLSFDPVLLFLIKILKRKLEFSKLKFTLVLHGSFEHIAGKDSERFKLPLPRKGFGDLESYRDLRKRGLTILLRKVAGKRKRWLLQTFSAFKKFSFLQYFLNLIFSEKRVLLWRNSADFKYIALSPHVIVTAGKYIDVKNLSIIPVILPTVFVPVSPAPKNEFIKFAVFGYGNSLMLHNVLHRLAKLKVSKPYEIRIIGMDNRGTEGFSEVTSPNPGKPLTRDEMEKAAQDIDLFLILYDKSRYRLSCSGSILESLSYTKPILHFDNDCINYFNQKARPIGIEAKSLDQFASKMKEMIENYDSFKPMLQQFRENIVQLRNEVAIENSLKQIKEAFGK